MEYIFTNGLQRQNDLWEEACQHLLNLPAEQIPLESEVTFEEPDKINGHTNLALTTSTYGSPFSTCVVRSDAPGFDGQRAALEAEAAKFGVTFNADRFYQETAIHELGHSMFAALSHAQRVKVVELFGANSDELSVLQPPGLWQDQIAEGIAETFKESFLPARYRVFPNRTDQRISYSLFPRFRALFRNAEAEGNRTFLIPKVGGGMVDLWRPPAFDPSLGWVDFNQGLPGEWVSFVPPDAFPAFEAGETIEYFLPYPGGGVSKLVIKDQFFMGFEFIGGLFFELIITLEPPGHSAVLLLTGDESLSESLDVSVFFEGSGFRVVVKRSTESFFPSGLFQYQTHWEAEGSNAVSEVRDMLGAGITTKVPVPPSSVGSQGGSGGARPSRRPVIGNQ